MIGDKFVPLELQVDESTTKKNEAVFCCRLEYNDIEEKLNYHHNKFINTRQSSENEDGRLSSVWLFPVVRIGSASVFLGKENLWLTLLFFLFFYFFYYEFIFLIFIFILNCFIFPLLIYLFDWLVD